MTKFSTHFWILGIIMLGIVVICSSGYGQVKEDSETQQEEESAKKRDMKKDMQRRMGPYTAKEFYPSMMELPQLSAQKRGQLQIQAHERMEIGIGLLKAEIAQLSQAMANKDALAMQEATLNIRDAIDQYESGLATQRALEEGQEPQEIALQWLKREMNLLPPPSASPPIKVFGMSVFHSVVCTILALFSVTMIWMYFGKMRRTAVLLQRLGSDQNVTQAAATTSKWSGTLRVSAIFPETPSVKTFRMVSLDGKELPFTFLAGQFLKLSVEADGKLIKRTYTISSSPTHRSYVEITVKREDHGVMSNFLHDHLQLGDELEITAPAGNFTFAGDESNSLVLIAGGVGITPMMSVIRNLTDRSWAGEIFLLFSFRSTQDFIFREELDYLQHRYPNLHVNVTTTRPEDEPLVGAKGRITKAFIESCVPNITSSRVHICGTPAMADTIKAILTEIGVTKEQVKMEAFGTIKRNPELLAQRTSPGTSDATVTFSIANKSTSLTIDSTILEASEEIGVDIDSGCRSGICGSCKVKIVSGKVVMECETALEADEKSAGIILACQSKSKADVTVEA